MSQTPLGAMELPEDWQDLRGLLGHATWALREAWSAAARLVATRLALALFDGLVPAVFVYGAKEVVDDLAAAGNLVDALPWLIVVGGLSFTAVALRPITVLVTARLSDELQLAVSLHILEHASALDLEYFESPANQNSLALIQASSAKHMEDLVDNLTGLAQKGLQLVGLAAVILLIEPLVVLILAILAIPYLVHQARLSRAQYTLESNQQGRRRWTTYFTRLLTNDRSLPEVRLYDLAPHLIERYRAFVTDLRDRHRKIYWSRALGGVAFGAAGSIVIYALVFRLAGRALAGETTVGSVAGYLLAVERLAATVTLFVQLTVRGVRSALVVSRLREFLEEEPPSRAQGATAVFGRPPSLEFEGVSFGYPGSNATVLHDVSFTVGPGETVALVGPNGAGKTTLTKLLGKLYRPSEGTIRVDGQDLATLSDESLRAGLAFVLQDFGRYEATAGENIVYGDWRRLGERPEEVRHIAAQVGADEMIRGLPAGFDTHLGRQFGEVSLSGGQWQLLATARAFARNASVLVFDEPTSNLDARREYRIFEKLRALAAERTVLLVSHRFSTVRMADRILVLDEGRLVEQGTHEELLALDGLYAHLFGLHTSMFEQPAAGGPRRPTSPTGRT